MKNASPLDYYYMARLRCMTALSMVGLTRVAPVILLILVTVTIVILLLLNTSTGISRSDMHNLGRMFLRENPRKQNNYSIVPLAASEHPSEITQNLMELFTHLAMPIKELVKYGIAQGLIMMVNASNKNDVNTVLVAASQHRASSGSWDINGALDGSIGELLAEVMEEVHVVEEAQNALGQAMTKCNHNRITECTKVEENLPQKELGASTEWPYKLHWYGQSLHSLVVFSSYRFSYTEFFVVALLGTLLSEKSRSKEPERDACAWIRWQSKATKSPFDSLGKPWHEKNLPSIQIGTKTVMITNDPQGTAYDVAVIKCSFEDPAGANGKGGYLYIKDNNEFNPVFHERPEEISSIQFEGEFHYHIAYCSPPILWELNATHLKEWFMYHHFLFHEQKTHYFIYHGVDINDKIMIVLRPLINRGLVTLIDMRSPRSNLLPGQYPSHHLAMNDCLHRVRYLAEWVFFWGFEDYLTISSGYTLSSILETHKLDPWISLGSVLWSNTYCCAEERTIASNSMTWAVDEMCFHLEHPICNDKHRATTCYGDEGQRKWIANPRLVFAASIHYALDPQWTGVALDTSIARQNLYNGLLNPNSSKGNCMWIKAEELEERPMEGRWWKDLSMRKYARAAHVYASSSNLFNSSFVYPSPAWPLYVPKMDVNRIMKAMNMSQNAIVDTQTKVSNR